MKKLLKYSLFALFLLSMTASFTSCNRGASCPAYNNIDPGRGNMNNPNNEAIKTGNNKRDVERKKKKELKARRFNRNKSTNLLPKHLRGRR